VIRILFGFVGFLAGWLIGWHWRKEQGLSEPSAMVDEEDEPHVEAEGEEEPSDPLIEELTGLREVTSALHESAAALDKQLGRVGREQFKVNTLSQAQQQQVQAALEQLRDLSALREADLASLRDQLRADQSAQRLVIIQQLLPALDGLDEALAAGQRLLAQASLPHGEAAQPASVHATNAGAWLTWRQRLAVALGRAELPTIVVNESIAWREPVAAWLAGIVMVQQRLLQVLAAEEVQPIAARGEMFDPHRHIAVEAVAAENGIPPGTIVDEYRCGYRVGDRILRAAEVVVAK